MGSKSLHGRFLSLIQDYLPKAFEINAFVIDTKHHKKGFGAKLFNHLLNEIYERYQDAELYNAPPIIINTFPCSAGFWKKMNFVVIGERKCKYFDDILIDWCLIYHPNENKLKKLQNECKILW